MESNGAMPLTDRMWRKKGGAETDGYEISICLWWLLALAALAGALAAPLALIPARLAWKKGHNFGLWWVYGWVLFPVAMIHVLLLPKKEKPALPWAAPADKGTWE